MDIDRHSRWRMASDDMATEPKHTMPSSEKEVQCGFADGKAVEGVEAEAVSSPHGHCG